MKIIKTLLIAGLIIVIVGLGGMLAVPGQLDAESNAINFPVYRNTATVTAIREMITELGWEKEAEAGDGKTLVITAADGNNSVVTFNYSRILARGKVSVTVETGAQYSAGKLITEIARRTGIMPDSAPLQTAAKPAAQPVVPAQITPGKKAIEVVEKEQSMELIKKTITTYITAGLARDREVLTNVCVKGSAVIKQACTDMHKIKGLADIDLVEIHASKEKALAISSSVTAKRTREGVLVFFLDNFDGSWKIDDIDFATSTAAEDKLVWFMLRNPKTETLVKVANK